MSTKSNPSYFTRQLLHWHNTLNQRDLPWKGVRDPYKIWLSEIILQQTRAEQGLAYYLKFVENFPTIHDLARATDEKVYKLWEGLGYYSRCKNLLFTARYISGELYGKFPDTYEELLKLKGVGPYTAAAIASFAFNEPKAVVDGNVYRVLARFLGNDTPIDLPEGKKYFQAQAEEFLDKSVPALYNQAIMDFGATVCTPKLAACETCCLQKKCVAFNTNTVYQLPVKANKISKEELFYYYLIFSYKNEVLIRKRIEKHIWQNLYEFYLVKVAEPLENAEEAVSAFIKEYPAAKIKISDVSATSRQMLTHKKINGTFIQLSLSKKIHLPGYSWIKKQALNDYPFPRIIYNYMQENKLLFQA